jgi:hypothetical protein
VLDVADLVVLHDDLQVLLGLREDVLLALLVLEPQLVEVVAAAA